MLFKKYIFKIFFIIMFLIVSLFLDQITSYYKTLSFWKGLLLMKFVYISLIVGTLNIIYFIRLFYQRINKRLFSVVIILFIIILLKNSYADSYINIDDTFFNQSCIISLISTPLTWKVSPTVLDGYDFYCLQHGTATNGYFRNETGIGNIHGNTGAGSNGYIITMIDLNESYVYNTDISKLELYCDIPGNNYNFLVGFYDEDLNCKWCYDYQNQNPASCSVYGAGSPCSVSSSRLGTDKCSTSWAKINTEPNINTTFRYIMVAGAGASITINNYYDLINLSNVTIYTTSTTTTTVLPEYMNDIIENNSLGITNFDLVNVNEGLEDTGSIFPRITFLTFRTGFLLFSFIGILLFCVVFCVIIIIFQILSIIIKGLMPK